MAEPLASGRRRAGANCLPNTDRCGDVTGGMRLFPVATSLSACVEQDRGRVAPMCGDRERHRDGTATPRKRPRGKTLFRVSSVGLERSWLELADEPDLGIELIAELLTDRSLSDGDQLPNVLGRRTAEVDQDIRVHMRDLGVPMTEALEPNLVDEPAGADPLDLLEDRSGTWMPLEPRMARPAPREILLHYLLHRALVTARQTERDRERDVASVVEDRVVIAELHIVRTDRLPLVFL